MTEILSRIQHMDPLWAYFSLFLSAFVENVFPPIPGDTVTVLGAYLVGTGTLNFWQVFASTTLGSVAGFMTIFGIAYFLERKIIEKHQPKWVSASHVERVEQWFGKYGYWVILFNRFLSGARSVISFVAGFSRMKPSYVFSLALVGCAAWNLILIYLGSSIGKNWQEIVKIIKIYNRFVAVIFVAILFFYLVYRIFKKKQSKT